MLGKVSTAGLGTVDRLAREVEQGRRSARWMGSGMAAMGLTVRAGTAAGGGDLRAVFGRLEHPHPGPGEAGPVRSRFLGATPQVFGNEAERLARALRRELTLGQRIEIAETVLGPAGALGVSAARRPYLVEQAVAAVAGSAVERSY